MLTVLAPRTASLQEAARWQELVASPPGSDAQIAAAYRYLWAKWHTCMSRQLHAYGVPYGAVVNPAASSKASQLYGAAHLHCGPIPSMQDALVFLHPEGFGVVPPPVCYA